MSKVLIPWADPFLGKEELSHIHESFKNQRFTSGQKVKKFEKLMAKYLNVDYAIAVSNGTVALDIALKTLKIGIGDEVIVPSMTYISSASSVSYQNAIPVFVDIDKKTFNIDVKSAEKAISKKTKAIIFIDYGGNASNIDEIINLGKKYNIPIVQDAAQSLGAKYRGKKIGANGDISTMSFHMAKIITTIEGGMIFTNNKKYYDEILIRRNIGEPKNKKYKHTHLGTNARMTELNAGIGISQIQKLEKFVKKRNAIAKRYDYLFSKSKLNIQVLKRNSSKFRNAYFLYPILIKNRDKIAKNLLKRHGIDTRIAYPMPIYKQPMYSNNLKSYKNKNCPNAIFVTKNILNLPIYPNMKIKDVDKVFNAIKEEYITNN